MEPELPKVRERMARSLALLAFAIVWFVGVPGCGLGPSTLTHTRLRYNDAVKETSEQQLLLNIVRLRYSDTPSSLAISTIADQHELSTSNQIVPLFTSAGAGDLGTYGSRLLPQLGIAGTSRPTLSYTPLDDEDFARRLFTPISLDGVAYLSKTTWPISSVFRLYLENLNWVSNAETASGPTPRHPPVYAEFRNGVEALQNLQDRGLVTIYAEERNEVLRDGIDTRSMTTSEIVECIKNDIDISRSHDEISLQRKRMQQVLRVGDVTLDDPDWTCFTNAFKLDPRQRTYDLTLEEVDPYLQDMPTNGLVKIDLETRSLLQVLFFVSHGVEVPDIHIENGIAPVTCDHTGKPFDWSQVLGDLIRIRSTANRHRPKSAQIAVRYRDHWFYIVDADRDTKSTWVHLTLWSKASKRDSLAKRCSTTFAVYSYPIRSVL
jgi:hypothetical protein